jgi:hypothetical protein
VSWPQVVVLVAMLLSGGACCVEFVTDRNYSARGASVMVALTVAIYAGFAGVLSAGGFW